MKNFREELRKILDNKQYSENEIFEAIDELHFSLISNASCLPVYASTFDKKGEIQHQRLSIEYAGQIITNLSERVNEFEMFINAYNEKLK